MAFKLYPSISSSLSSTASAIQSVITRGVKMAEIESSSAANNPISPFYGNLFQRIQFHGIVINRTHNDLLPIRCLLPILTKRYYPTRMSVRFAKQYLPSELFALRNHYKIHQQQYASNFLDYNNNKEGRLSMMRMLYTIHTRCL